MWSNSFVGVCLFASVCATMMGQLNWTPVFLGGSNQIDMWTKESSGCECQYNSSRHDCACCVKPEGCQCGSSAPNKCAQCGLQQYCNNMCNITISQQTIFSESKSNVGQIKSPSVQGPALCWYLLQPEPGHRLELQIYRLVNVGRFNGTGCQSGFVHLVDEGNTKAGSSGVQICGENERFAPPVVLFVDKGVAKLTLKIDEPTIRSQFLAHYSFTALNNTQGVGFRPNGGKRIEHTSCDWLYQDFTCVSESHGCVLASPGYPGLYHSHSTCNYHITMSSLRTKVKIVFLTLSLPLNRCATDYINVYQGPSSSGSLLTTVCSNKRQELIYSGPNLLLEFKSGPSLPPYDYNGFVARLEFVDRPTTTEPTVSVPSSTSKNANRISVKKDGIVQFSQPTFVTSKPSQLAEKNCVVRIFGNSTRSGHFDMRTLPANCTNCTVIFTGKPTDIIHISLFNYRLNASECYSFVEIIDGNVQQQPFKILKKICSPVTKYARNAEGRFHEQQTFFSSNNSLSIYFRRSILTQLSSESEYVDGAFSFLDEHAEGKLKPDTLCDVTYYGLTSSSKGRIHNHGSQHLFWNVEGPLRCSQRFVPTTNQSVILKITSLQRLSSDVCNTMCGDSGCECTETSEISNNLFNFIQYDHLLISNEKNVTLSCLCGSFKEEWLPIIIRSWTPINVVYSVAKYSWAQKGFSFEAEYKFEYDNACGYQIINHHDGLIQTASIPEGEQLNYYYNQVCTWVLNSRIERQLHVAIESSQNRKCSAWNITLFERTSESSPNTEQLVHQFCPKDGRKSYDFPWKLNIIVIKLTAMTRTLPLFQIKWKSQVVQSNTKMSILTPEAANKAANFVSHIVPLYLFIISYFYKLVT